MTATSLVAALSAHVQAQEKPGTKPSDPAPPAAKQAAHPAVFDTRPYAEAKAAAEKEKKFFLVKATAVWCLPCKQMDRTTMVDPKVVEWLKANAIIVSVDVDKEEALAESLKISAMPTMIAFKDGKEFDRVVGYRGPEQCLAWLQGLAEGKTSVEAIRRRAATPAPDGTIDVDARYEEAQSLLESRKYAEATDAYVWLWEHVLEHEPAMAGVRGSFMASAMHQLAEQHADAKKRFTALRDAAAKGMNGEKVDVEALDDWLVLNGVIGDEDATLAWFDRVKSDPRWHDLLQRHSFRYKDLLVARGRLGDYGALIADPAGEIRRNHGFLSLEGPMPEGMDAQMKARIRASLVDGWRREAAGICAAVLAAHRDADALAAATQAMKLDPDPELVRVLAETALESGQARAVHMEWLDAAIASAKKSEADAKKSTSGTTDRGAAPPGGERFGDDATPLAERLAKTRSRVGARLAQDAGSKAADPTKSKPAP